MGHYDDAYEHMYEIQRKHKFKQNITSWLEVKEALQSLQKFCSQNGMETEYNNFENTITSWRLRQGLLIENPEIILKKLKE